MTEILLSFFAVIGITLLAIRICDYLFYRKTVLNAPLILNFSDKCEEEIISVLELIATVRQRSSGKAVLSRLVVLVKEDDIETHRICEHYLNVFELPGLIFSVTDDSWRAEI